MNKYPHGLTLNAVCAAIDDYQRHEDSVPEEGILAAFNTLLGHSDIADALRSMERTADANMAAAQAMRDDMYHWKQRAEAAEAKLAELAELAKQESQIKVLWASFSSDHARTWQYSIETDLRLNPGDLLFTRPAPAADLVPGEWTNEQCLEFLSIAFRHAEISGDIEMNDIRLAVKMVNAAAPEVE
ncbi:hypothetical protein [Pantoea agglomerans]|uniref:hypothetical protein n=1 Tax=Enterobacter agglomerans TaxID=549 RepID=UPI0016546CB9|nr:hypothetical protein [Pantoea agglomerans]